MAAFGEPTAIEFGLQSEEDRLVESHVKVQSYEFFIGKDPVPNGPFSANMGVTDMRHICNICRRNRRDCPGHPGHIELPFPVVHPFIVAEVRRWLRVVCLFCSSLMGDPLSHEKVARVALANRLAAAAAAFSPKNPLACPKCRRLHPKVIKTPSDRFSFTLVFERQDKTVEELIMPFQIDRIFQRISDESVIALGKSPEKSHPRRFLIHNLQVPPVSIRPAIRSVGGGGFSSSTNDVNSILQYIIKATAQISGGTGPIQLPAPGEAIQADLASKMMNLQQLVCAFLVGSGSVNQQSNKRGVVASNGKPVEAIAQRWSRKQGRLRKNLAGGRSWKIGRNTITGLSQLSPTQLAIPESFARSLQVMETVTPGNLTRLMRFFLNGKRQYPGATRVWRESTRTIHDVEGLRGQRLEPGDCLYRDVINGDMACFNRQPSLERSAIGAHELVVLRDVYGNSPLPTPPLLKTFQFNVLATPLYNADFDGDEMNMIVIDRPGPRAEVEILASVENAFISPKSSGPAIGQVQDSTLGSMLLSMCPQMGKLHAMTLFERSNVRPDFSFMDASKGDIISGAEAVSQLLRRYPISLKRKPSSFSASTQPYVNFTPEETLTQIIHGKLISGPLDKATVGGGAQGGLFHRISRAYGPKAALECIFALQQMAIAHLNQRGFTVSISDMVLPSEAEAEIDEIVAGMVREADLNSERLIDGKILPPLNVTTHRHFERLQLEALKVPDSVLGPILKSADCRNNGLVQMITSGSKGNYKNAVNIQGVVGQITINSRRIEPGANGRTLAYYPRGDLSVEASGFIRSKYIKGLTGAEHYFGAKNGRNDLTNKALSTAETGHQNRKSIMALQSAIVDPLRVVCGPSVIQYLYGEDGMDPRQLESVELPTFFLSNHAVVEKYTLEEGPAKEQWHAQEVAQLIRDRDDCRAVQLNLEMVDFNYGVTNKTLMAVNVKAIAESHFQGVGGDAPTLPLLKAMHDGVNEFCRRLPYLLLNATQEKKKAPVPPFMRAAVDHLARIVRVELSSVQLLKYNATIELLGLVFEAIRLRFIKSLISPGEAVGVLASQSVSEPLTQYMLDSHHRSVSGGTNKSGIDRPKEIMGARPTEKESSPEMLLRGLVPGPDGKMVLTNDKALLQELADSIKLLSLEQVTDRWHELYEPFPTEADFRTGEKSTTADVVPDDYKFYPPFTQDWGWMSEFLESNPLLPPPSTLTQWCFRFVLDRLKLVMKSISLETIVGRLRELFPHIYILHSPEGVTKQSPNIVIRMYLTSQAFRKSSSKLTQEKSAEVIFGEVYSTPLRGIAGITDATVITAVRHRVVPDGPDAGKLEQEEGTHMIKTVGTNLHEVLLHSRIDKKTATTSSIQEVIDLFGIEAGRTKIINEIRRVMGGKAPNIRHLQMYADQMTRTGVYTSCEAGGIARREPNNIMLGALAHGPVKVFTRAAVEAVVNPNYGMATPLLLGSVPKFGTGSIRLAVDRDFVASRLRSTENIINDL